MTLPTPHHADDLLYQLRLQVNMADKAGSEAVACSHRERALAYAVELDRWLCGGNPPPADWCAGVLRALGDGTLSVAAVATAAASAVPEDAPLGATCANQPLTAL